ncbi:MAG: ABC transporter permease [Lachnospiraceae bacterium]|nr:ABC transporter permease [Lachnospiraceae bacterium]
MKTEKSKSEQNRRRTTIVIILFSGALLIAITVIGVFLDPESYAPQFANKNLAPCVRHLFGTDWMGRDMFARTIKGLSISICIGLIASAFTSVIALFLGVTAATFGGKAALAFNWMVDLFMGIPHLILLILISMLVGKGAKGVAIGVIITHWCSLGRIVHAEVLSLRGTQYIQASYRMGKSRWWVALHHMMPHVIPQFIVGLVLMFPHAIMHESSVTFLGFGLRPEEPAIGIILSESMRYLTTGMWWLAVYPGISLLLIVILFEVLGKNIRLLMDPYSAQE